MRNLILEIWYFLAQNAQIWAFGIEVWEAKASKKFQISTILKLCVILDRFAIFGVLSIDFCFFDWFRLVLAGFG